jgi:serine/arginine repetitive matrix protein 2
MGGRTSFSPPSPSSVAAVTHFESDSASPNPPQPHPTRVVITPTFERVPTNGGDYSEWEETTRIITETTPKRNEGGYWERVKGAFSRSTSQNGRRSRTNSVGGRPRDYTDSSISRESGTSLTSGKTDKDGTFAFQQSQPALQTSNSSPISASPLPPPSTKGVTSPFPAHPTNDLSKYMDSKLFPFPGMMELEKKRVKAMLNSASSPDISSGADPASNGSGSSNATGPSPELGRDRKLSHQASDTRLLAKFSIPQAPPMITTVSSSSTDYFPTPSPQSNGPTTPTHTPTLKLPTTREGVKKWLSAKKIFSSGSTNTPERLELGTKSSMTDLFFSKKDDIATDWEDVGSEKSRGATSTSNSTLKGKMTASPATDTSFRQAVDDAFGSIIPNKLGKPGDLSPHVTETPISESGPELPSPPAPPSSATPDPQSSMDDYHSRSGSASLSTLSSHPVIDATKSGSQDSSILDLMDECLGRADSSLPPIEDPPRRLLLSSPVLQVVNSNTVKDRFLFLFNDILVVAKPILHDQDSLLDPSTLTVLDRRFIIKSVVQLRNLRVKTDRDDNRTQAYLSGSIKHSLTQTFVHNFAKDPDHAIATLFEKARSRDDPIGLGQLMFRTLDLDRAKLGDYLSRRASKLILKAYIDGFGFTGLRIDHALRVFLQSVNVPSRPTPTHNPMEFILDAFGSRWYEANLGAVAYDKDLAVKLAKAIVQLNEVLHGGVGQEPGPTSPPLRNVIARDFASAFRRYDPRGQVSDDILEDIYTSIRNEHLTQARAMVPGETDITIVIKRALPTRLTYRVQSEPIILRIPQQDSDLSVQLFGEDLIFDPPVLTFAKSLEASFRITGTSLGLKKVTMRRSGSNALLYSGLPLSNSIVVERAFMRNTFQLAFSDMHCDKRRYMFSVDDPVLRHQWAASLKRQVEIASSNYATLAADAGTTKFHIAAEAVAFRVLYESLLCDEFGRNTRSLSPPPQFPPTNGTVHRFDQQQQRSFGAYMHARSKSRSQWYHNSMAGRMEIDLEVPIDDEIDLAEGVASPQKMWKGQEIEVLCRQNSSVAGVISRLLHLKSREDPNGIERRI